MKTPFIIVSLIFAFISPIAFAKAIKNILEKKSYTIPIILVSIGFTFIVATLCLYAY